MPATHYHRPHYDTSYDYKPHKPPYRYDRPKYVGDKYLPESHRDRDYWGFDKNTWGSYGGLYGNFGDYDYHKFYNKNRYDIDRRNYYLPPKPEKPKDWGQYGGTYGNGGHLQYYGYGNGQRFDYWGFNKYEQKHNGHNEYHFYVDLPPKGDSYLPEPNPGSYLPRPSSGSYLPRPDSGSYLPRPSSSSYTPIPSSVGYPSRPSSGSYLPGPSLPSYLPKPFKPSYGISPTIDNYENSILPAEPRFPTYDFLRDGK